MFEGSNIAIVTPLKNNKVDEKQLRYLVDFQIENGTNGIVPCGTTGESATLTYEEHCNVIDIVIDQVKKRVPVIAGTGSNSTHETIYFTRHAEEMGADGALIITPYYNKPNVSGLKEHFKRIGESVELPLILYNIASRTGLNMTADTMVELAAEVANIKGVKEASGDLKQVGAVIKLAKERYLEFTVIAGDDFLTLPIMSLGGTGVISVAANIVPKPMSDMVDAMSKGEVEKALEIHLRLFPLFEAMFLETNPIPVKKAAEIMGLASGDVRLPLGALSAANEAKLRRVLEGQGLV